MLDWFKNNILFLGTIAFLLCVIIVKDCNHHNKLQELTKIDVSLKPVVHYTDFKGVSHAQIAVQVVDDKKAFKEATKALKHEIKGANQIKDVTTVTSEVDTSFENLFADITIDSLITFSVIDSYINVKSIYSRETHKGNIQLKSRDTITYTKFVDKHFFKANEIKIDISNKSPYNKITYGNSISLKEPKPRISLGIIAGYNPIEQKVIYGVGICLPLISIKTR